MRFLGNYSSWVDPRWSEYMSENVGEIHPQQNTTEYGEDNNLQLIKDYGYDIHSVFWYSYESRSFPFEITLPIDAGSNIDWWFVKMMCGNFIPMHKDHTHGNFDGQSCRRFWMPLQDYIEGHVFINGDEFIKDYSAGDLFEYDQHERHGGFNISMGIPRYTFNFAIYE